MRLSRLTPAGDPESLVSRFLSSTANDDVLARPPEERTFCPTPTLTIPMSDCIRRWHVVVKRSPAAIVAANTPPIPKYRPRDVP